MALQNSLPERYKSIIGFYLKGKSTALEMLKTDLAHWPPKGMNITNPPNIEVDFKSAVREGEILRKGIPSFWNMALSYALIKNYPIIGSLFFGLTALKRMYNKMGFVRINAEPNTIYINDLWRAFNVFQRGRRFLSHVINHELKHVFQARDKMESLSSSLDDNRTNPLRFVKESRQSSKTIKYLAEECEIQARLHTLVVGSFHQHGKFPLNTSELLEALYVQGVKVPKKMLWANRETEEGDAAFQFYRPNPDLHARYADKKAIGDLNLLIGALDEKHKEHFFKKLLPFIWGDIIELWGDQQGHKRFGHTHNIQLREIFYRAAGECSDLIASRSRRPLRATRGVASIVSNDNSLSPRTDKRILEKRDKFVHAINAMDREDAVDLGCMLLRGYKYKELGKASSFVPYKRGQHYDPITATAVKAIWDRADITTEDKIVLNSAADQYRDINQFQVKATLQKTNSQFTEAVRGTSRDIKPARRPKGDGRVYDQRPIFSMTG